MPRPVYFDVNVCLDVFEQKPELFPAFEALVKNNAVDLVVSDLDLTEILKGNHLPTFTEGINRLLSLSAKWGYLTGLAAREVEYEHAIYHGKAAEQPFMVFGTWPEFLPLITSQEERDSVSADLEIPTAAALLELYPPNSVGGTAQGEVEARAEGTRQRLPADAQEGAVVRKRVLRGHRANARKEAGRAEGILRPPRSPRRATCSRWIRSARTSRGTEAQSRRGPYPVTPRRARQIETRESDRGPDSLSSRRD